MTVFAGILETALAPLLNRLRAIFPPEISGLIIVMIGLSAAVSGLRSIFGPTAEPVSMAEWWVAGITLASMAILNIWGKGALRMLCALIGLGIGYIAAASVQLLGRRHDRGEQRVVDRLSACDRHRHGRSISPSRCRSPSPPSPPR